MSLIREAIDTTSSLVQNSLVPLSTIVSSEPSPTPLISDADEQLIFYLSFQGPTHLTGLVLRVPEEEEHGLTRAPSKILFFKNASAHMSFSDCLSSKADHQIHLEDSDYVMDDYGLRSVTIVFPAPLKWMGVRSLVVFVETNIGGGEETVVSHIVPLGSMPQGAGHGLQMGKLEEIKEQKRKGG
ncbi:hypothetical protein RCL1_004221 [Eukaryota sp. TZLM3-RCL]